jgi:hypothetical protein
MPDDGSFNPKHAELGEKYFSVVRDCTTSFVFIII